MQLRFRRPETARSNGWERAPAGSVMHECVRERVLLRVLAIVATLMLLLPGPAVRAEAAWEVVTIPNLPSGAEPGRVWSRSPNDVYVWAERTTPDTVDTPESFLLHWDGTGWAEVLTLPGHSPVALFGTGTSQVFATAYKCESAANCGPEQRGHIFRSEDSGATWVEDSLPIPINGLNLGGFSGTPGNVHMLAADRHIFRFDGSEWKLVFSGSDNATGKPYSLSVWSENEGYFVSCWGWGRWDGTQWTFNGIQFDFCDAYSSWGQRDAQGNLHLYAVGSNNFENGVRVWRFDEARQSFGAKYEFAFSDGSSGHGSGVWGSGPNDIYVIGYINPGPDDGRIYHYDGTAWQQVAEVGPIPRPKGISGSGPEDVWITLSDGRLLHYGHHSSTGPMWQEQSPIGTAPSPRYAAGSAYDAATDRLILFGGEDQTGLPRPQDVWVLANASGAAGAPRWIELSPTGGPPMGRWAGSVVYDPTANRLIVHGGCGGNCSPALADTWVLANANGLGGEPRWIELPAAPVARAGHTAVFDPGSNRMIVFGEGEGVSILSNANGIGTPTWTQLSPTGTPPLLRTGAAAVYDPLDNRLIIHGGTESQSQTTRYLDDLWVLTNANGLDGTPEWIELTPQGTGPGVRYGHALTYDPGTNRAILFGGGIAYTPTAVDDANDVWVLTNANGLGGTPEWSELMTTGGPPEARQIPSAAYATESGRLIVAMGRHDTSTGSQLLNDVWILTEALEPDHANDDLFANADDLWLWPLTIRQGNLDAGLGLTVHRASGKQTLGGVAVDFYDGDPDAGGTLIGRTYLSAIGPRSQISTEKVSWNPDEGSYNIYAVIDPDDVITEADESNNTASRTIEVLPPHPDQIAPRVDSFSINNGRAQTRRSEVQLQATASDNDNGSGIAQLLYIEYVYLPSANNWVPVRQSGWLPYATSHADYAWNLTTVAGIHYLQAWVADNAGNISLAPFVQSINYIPDVDQINEGEARVYRQRLQAGEIMRVRLIPSIGDPDLYIWPPGSPANGEPPYVSNLRDSAVDEIVLTAASNGQYQIEVYGYTRATYILEISVEETPVLMHNRGAASLAAQLNGIDPNKPFRQQPVIPLDAVPESRLVTDLYPIPIPEAMEHTVFIPLVRR